MVIDDTLPDGIDEPVMSVVVGDAVLALSTRIILPLFKPKYTRLLVVSVR